MGWKGSSRILQVVTMSALFFTLSLNLALPASGDSDEDCDVVQNLGIAIDSEDNLHIVWHEEEEIEREPHSGLTDTSYTSYCTRIDANGSVADDPWLVAPSKIEEEPPAALTTAVVLLATFLVIAVVTVLTGYVKKNRWRHRTQKPIQNRGRRSFNPHTGRKIKK